MRVAPLNSEYHNQVMKVVNWYSSNYEIIIIKASFARISLYLAYLLGYNSNDIISIQAPLN